MGSAKEACDRSRARLHWAAAALRDTDNKDHGCAVSERGNVVTTQEQCMREATDQND